jgi:drug/metabolite transporter (DMT)-like permease
VRYTLQTMRTQANLGGSGWGWLVATGVLGGALAPFLNTSAYQRLPASNVALITSLEGVFTLLMAWWVFKERTSSRTLWGALLITVGCGLLLMAQVDAHGWNVGGLYAMGGCLVWSLDTNVVSRLRDC